MHRISSVAGVIVLMGLVTSDLDGAQTPLPSHSDPVVVASGGAIIPLFDGWYRNPDDSYTLCFGYYSTNAQEDVTIPLGPSNRVEPVIYDGGQPDLFERIPEEPFDYRRRYCVFPVRVPADFTRSDGVVWTLGRSPGTESSVPGRLVPSMRLDEPSAPGRGAEAPVLRFGSDGPVAQGRSGVTVGPLRSSVGAPLPLEVHEELPLRRAWVGWAKQNGPGPVAFSESNTPIYPGTAVARTTVTFSVPGRYLIRIQAIDDPVASFEFHCCWTNMFVDVVVE